MIKHQVEDNPAMKESISTSSNNQGLNLAAELASSIPDWNNQKESESDQTIQSKKNPCSIFMQIS